MVIILAVATPHLYAGAPVKSLSGKALKTIEGKYGKETRSLFSGKGSDKNVLALKRLIAEGIDPDLAIAAITKYQDAKKLRSGSAQKREALNSIEALFVGSQLSAKKGLAIILGSGSAVIARESKKALSTSQSPNKPSCSAKKTVTKRAKKIKFNDPDQLAEHVILNELDGKTQHELLAVGV